MLDLNRLYEERVVYSIPGMEQASSARGHCLPHAH